MKPEDRLTCIDLAHFGGHARYILPPLRPFVVADENIISGGTFLNFFAFFAPQAQPSTAQPQHSAVNSHKQQSRYAPIRARQRKQEDRVGSSQHVVEL